MHPVLIVETDETVRQELAELLAESGFSVLAFNQAWDIFLLPEADYSPLLLVTGINLGPGFDGFKLATAVRCRWPALPIMGIAGRPSRYQPLDDRFHDWFRMQPFRPERFIEDIRSLVRSAGYGG
jgi:DNA-binding response OmpR family regulator